MKKPRIEIADDAESFARLAADLFVSIGRDAIEKREEFNVALSGGSTPKASYELLATDEYLDKLAWDRVKFYFGDERNVPPDHGDSNFRMAKAAMLGPLDIDDENIYRWHTELGDPEQTAAEYGQAIGRLGDPPMFDLLLLGLGEDGHTASLFPGSEALKESKKFAVANWIPALDQYRFTLTFPAINSASNIVFMVAGEAKSRIAERVINGTADASEFPAAGISPQKGELIWMLDRGAASRIEKKADLHLEPTAP